MKNFKAIEMKTDGRKIEETITTSTRKKTKGRSKSFELECLVQPLDDDN